MTKTITYNEAEWKLVPRVRTAAMKDAGKAAYGMYQSVVDVYEAMLGAAPEHPAAEVGDVPQWNLSARVADLIHLLQFAEITTPSPGDAAQARKAMSDIKVMLTKQVNYIDVFNGLADCDPMSKPATDTATPQHDASGFLHRTPEQIESRARQFGERLRAISDAEKAIQNAVSPLPARVLSEHDVYTTVAEGTEDAYCAANPGARRVWSTPVQQPAQCADSEPDHGERMSKRLLAVLKDAEYFLMQVDPVHWPSRAEASAMIANIRRNIAEAGGGV